MEYVVAKDLAQYDLTSMKIGIYGGAAMAPALVKECKERLYIDLVQIYGMTEMGTSCCISRRGGSNYESWFSRHAMF